MSDPRPATSSDWVPDEPPAWLYRAAALVSVLSSLMLVSLWLTWVYALVAALIAIPFALLRVWLNEPIGEAIVIALIVVGMLILVPKNFWTVLLAFPAGIGIAVGSLATGIRKC